MINWNRINELRDEIGSEDFKEVAEMFLDEVREGITALTDANDMSATEAAYHNLKGSALNLGFSEFADLCQQGETAAAHGKEPKFHQGLVAEIFNQSLEVFAAKSR